MYPSPGPDTPDHEEGIKIHPLILGKPPALATGGSWQPHCACTWVSGSFDLPNFASALGSHEKNTII
jgi:hypothetical protein